MHEITPLTTGSPFDAIMLPGERWSARDLMSQLGYGRWENFAEAIDRAKSAALAQGYQADDLFRAATKRGAGRPAEDFHLSRFAAYLVAMNGDPRKPEIAAAQAYFAIKTREAEIAPAMSQLDILAASIAALQAQERQIAAIDAKAQRALDAVEAIKPAQRDELYYSGRAWSRLRYTDSTLHYLKKLGGKAGVIGRAAGLEPDDVPDERYGVVNGWPLWVWDAAHDAIQNPETSSN